MSDLIYKICPRFLWRAAEASGVFSGASIDLEDGYIHFSTSGQVRETAALHFKDQSDLVLAAIEAEKLGDMLKYEESRGGLLFPHLYGKLPMGAVAWSSPLPLAEDGRHVFPDLQTGKHA